MKDYTSKEISEIAKENSNRKTSILLNWIDSDAQLIFHMDTGKPMKGVMIFFSKYDYVVRLEGQDTISIIAKHAVSCIDRM